LGILLSHRYGPKAGVLAGENEKDRLGSPNWPGDLERSGLWRKRRRLASAARVASPAARL